MEDERIETRWFTPRELRRLDSLRQNQRRQDDDRLLCSLSREEIDHRMKRLRAMADLHFLLIRGFAEGAAERLVIKQRIVAESVLAARLRSDDAAFDDAAKRLHQLAIAHQRDHAHEPRRAIRHAAHPLEQQLVVALRPSHSGPAKRAECTPGAPPSASTSRPESSANTHPSRVAVIQRLARAVSSNVAPCSSGGGASRPARISKSGAAN